MSFLEEIESRIKDFELDEGGDWPIFIDVSPSDSAPHIALFESGGEDPEPSYPLERPSLQVRIRAPRFRRRQAKNKMRELDSLLHGTSQWLYKRDELPRRWVLGEPIAVHYGMIQAQGGLADLGLDENENVNIVRNYRIMREEL